jgi:hypothetical protein
VPAVVGRVAAATTQNALVTRKLSEGGHIKRGTRPAEFPFSQSLWACDFARGGVCLSAGGKNRRKELERTTPFLLQADASSGLQLRVAPYIQPKQTRGNSCGRDAGAGRNNFARPSQPGWSMRFWSMETQQGSGRIHCFPYPGGRSHFGLRHVGDDPQVTCGRSAASSGWVRASCEEAERRLTSRGRCALKTCRTQRKRWRSYSGSCGRRRSRGPQCRPGRRRRCRGPGRQWGFRWLGQEPRRLCRRQLRRTRRRPWLRPSRRLRRRRPQRRRPLRRSRTKQLLRKQHRKQWQPRRQRRHRRLQQQQQQRKRKKWQRRRRRRRRPRRLQPWQQQRRLQQQQQQRKRKKWQRRQQRRRARQQSLLRSTRTNPRRKRRQRCRHRPSRHLRAKQRAARGSEGPGVPC